MLLADLKCHRFIVAPLEDVTAISVTNGWPDLWSDPLPRPEREESLKPHAAAVTARPHAPRSVLLVRVTVVALLAAHSFLLGYAACLDSACWDEVGHLGAGLSHWYHGNFNSYQVNPPLVRLVACAPVALLARGLDIGNYDFDENPKERSEFLIGEKVVTALGARAFWLLTVARWATIPLSLLGMTVCFRWARELYGAPSGLLAAALWMCSPTFLAYGHLITPDAAAAALGVSAAFAFWKWLQLPIWPRALFAGVSLGFAELTKTTWLVMFALWPVLWLVWRDISRRRNEPRPAFRTEAIRLTCLLCLGLFVLNLGYGFEGSFKRLDQFDFHSTLLGGAPSSPGAYESPRNTFACHWSGRLRLPLPANYVHGIDYVKMEFERGYWSFLRGEWRFGGWRYYYFYAMLIKEPLGSWLMALLAVGATCVCGRLYSAAARDELILAFPLLTILFLVSSQTGFNHHLRYVLPAFPFGIIWISKIGRCWPLRHRCLTAAVGLAFAWSAVSSLSVFPQSLSYYNELAGGPEGGHWHLCHSNSDWGQGLLRLKKWYDHNPQARPLYLAYDLSLVDPRILGIDWRTPPVGPMAVGASELPPEELGPKPGWYAVSVNRLHTRPHLYDYLHGLEPATWAGYTTPIYHIMPKQANLLRRKYGLPELTEGSPDQSTSAPRRARRTP